MRADRGETRSHLSPYCALDAPQDKTEAVESHFSQRSSLRRSPRSPEWAPDRSQATGQV
ncbi:hypothetical protein [uncultured Porphyromonas sp.]|uniref:hypothetical protein n=1 Tax=uncultured Porphyromonas sp. TaxID=159274 RepID=UPI0026361C10|nr:hypothetical protein [uncultured Porphyromonas sp.]